MFNFFKKSLSKEQVMEYNREEVKSILLQYIPDVSNNKLYFSLNKEELVTRIYLYGFTAVFHYKYMSNNCLQNNKVQSYIDSLTALSSFINFMVDSKDKSFIIPIAFFKKVQLKIYQSLKILDLSEIDQMYISFLDRLKNEAEQFETLTNLSYNDWYNQINEELSQENEHLLTLLEQDSLDIAYGENIHPKLLVVSLKYFS